MGVLRSIGKAVGGAIFTLSLVSLIVSIGLVQFTEYENMKTIFNEIFSSQIEGGLGEISPESVGKEAIEGMTEKELGEMYQAFLEMCEGKESVDVPISESGETITIDCNELRAAQSEEEGLEAVIGDVAATSIFDGIYYKEYDCGFLDCIQAGQVGIVISAQGHEFFKRVRLYLAAGVAAGAAIILISAERWSARLKGLGWPLVFTGISYFLMDFTKNIIVPKLPAAEQAGIDIMSLVDKMIAPIMNIFLIVLVVGVVLTAGGYALAYKEKKEKKKVKKSGKKSRK